MLNVTIVPVLTDNYSYIAQSGNDVAVIDPGEPGPLEIRLAEMGVTPTLILNTHHHSDHIAGNRQLKRKYGCKVIGPMADIKRMPDLDEGVKEGHTIRLGDETLRVIETPGHTSGHICIYAESAHILFAGDTLFSMGCGRLIEGTAEQMWNSLEKIMALPDDTQIYCGHEYTLSNAKFCIAIEKNNADIQARLSEVQKLTANGKPTIPTTLAQEKKTNVFLRTGKAASFTQLRMLKDNFQG